MTKAAKVRALSHCLARADQPGWAADAQTGCRVWNARPQPNQRVTWSGVCQNGFAQGEGVEQWIENGQSGNRLEGQFRDGRLNGHGVFTVANGARFEGEFRDGKLNGHAVGTYADGSRDEGEWQDGKKYGHGVETFANGNRYEGEWQVSKPNGFGGRGRTNVGRGLALLMRSARLDGCVSSPVRQISAIVWRNRLFGRT